MSYIEKIDYLTNFISIKFPLGKNINKNLYKSEKYVNFE